MLSGQRIDSIHNFILKTKSATIEELSKAYDVSHMTIRRDLDKIMKRDSNVKRCHGGAMLVTEVSLEEGFESKKVTNIDAKLDIVKRAFDLINDNDTIYLDAGTTVFELAKLILESDLKLTIITNDLETAKILINSSSEVIVTGGNIQKSTGCMFGSFAEEMLRNVKIKIAFMGATSINEKFEVLTPSIEKRTMKSQIIGDAMSSYLLVDDSKFNRYSTYVIYSLKDFTGVITNKEFGKNERRIIKEENISIMY